MQIGPLARATMRALATAAREAQAPQVCDFNDAELAEVILQDPPYYRHGESAINGRGHGAWALAIQGRYDEAWFLYQPLITIGPKILDNKKTDPGIPIGQLLLFFWLALQRGALQEAYLAQRLASRQKAALGKTLQEDFRAMTEELISSSRQAIPIPVPIAYS